MGRGCPRRQDYKGSALWITGDGYGNNAPASKKIERERNLV